MRFLLTAVLVTIVGCGGAHKDGVGNDSEGELMATQDGVMKPSAENSPPVPSESLEVAIQGSFENASCGERKYNRRISFQSGGVFEATDEVAPCPPGSECVWSGIIHWKGTWTLEDQIISIEPAQSENERMPETLPDSFVILNETPLSLGEKEGNVVCPYSKAQ